MTIVRKLLAMLFCLVLVLGLLPPAPAAEAATQLTYDDVTSIVTNYYNVVTSNGSKTAYWNAGIRSNGTSTLKKQADAGEYAKAVTYKSCGLTASTHSHANGCTSNLFKGVGSVDSSSKLDVTAADAQCSGFAAYMEYVIFKTTSLSSFTVYGGNNALPSNYEVKPGDQVRYSGHSYVIYKVSGDTAYIIECNNPSGSCAIHKGTKSVSTIKRQSYNGSTSFYISSPAVKLQTYTVGYDANGGTGAPASQTKTKDIALSLSNEIPSRASVSDGSYTVTLNPNGGSVSCSSLTAQKTACYSFLCWNTVADGSGNAYAPGDSYATNASVTLFAIWYPYSQVASVSLPTPTRAGYSFVGWGTSSMAGSGYTGSYTPSSNVTLYAVWRQDLPTITTQPKSVRVAVGETARFTVAASGASLSYRWQWSADSGSTWNNSSSATTGYNTATLQVSATAARNGYQYRCKVTNGAGTVTSSAATLTVTSKPGIVTQPKSVSVDEGEVAKFIVEASGTGLSYQWQWRSGSTGEWKDSTVTGCKSKNLYITAESRRNGYQYRCAVTNSYGTVYTKEATLTIN